MSDNDTVFNADQQATTTTSENMVEVLVGEGKKYATVEELAKAYYNADGFIEQLKDENRQLRETTKKQMELEEALAKLQSQEGSVNHNDEANNVSKNTVDASLIEKMVEQTLAKVETTKAVQGNLKLADQKLKEVFGEDARKVYNEIASTPAMQQSLMTLAQQSPDDFVKFFVTIKGQTPQTQVDTTGIAASKSVNTVNLQSMHGNRVGDPECKEYWNNLRQTNPNLYYSQDMQIKMNNAAIKNQQKFFGS